jgi:hypothetical protein
MFGSVAADAECVSDLFGVAALVMAEHKSDALCFGEQV